MQFGPIVLKALKPKETDFEPQTLGEHIRKRRLELALSQKEVAKQLRINPFTLLNWEKERTTPRTIDLGRVFAFLGYDPFPLPTTIPERLLHERRKHGWSAEDAARQLGVDRTTWQDWERGELILFRKHRTKVAHFLGVDSASIDAEMRARWNGKHRRWVLPRTLSNAR